MKSNRYKELDNLFGEIRKSKRFKFYFFIDTIKIKLNVNFRKLVCFTFGHYYGDWHFPKWCSRCGKEKE
jgi:hypothetical protein